MLWMGIVGLLMTGGWLAVVLAETPVREDAQPPATTAPAEAPAAERRAFAPIAYFNDRCGGCHGNYGSFWGQGFAAHLDDRSLTEMVREMAEGPAQAPLEDQPLAALVAYNRSLADGLPFVIVTARRDGTLRGEVTPGSQVVIELPDRKIAAQVEDHTWTVAVDPLPPEDAQATIVATRDGKTTRLPWRQWHSHGQPMTRESPPAH